MKQDQPSVAILNDTSMYNSHFGCQLVCQTFREQLARVGLKLHVSLPGNFDLDTVDILLKKVDIIIVNGEGSIHHGKSLHLIRIAGRYPSVLINCVYQDNPRLAELREFRLVAARESLSAEALSKHGADPLIVPDVMFASSFLNSFTPLISPNEDLGITDNVTNPEAGFPPHTPLVAGYLQKLCSFKRLCIGRFHAAVAASCLGIPFATWDSNTWKLRGMMADMGLSHLHSKTLEDAIRHVPSFFDPSIVSYTKAARLKVEKCFDEISLLAHYEAKQ